MPNNIHVIELLPAFALDCLDEEEKTQVTEHLATCPECRAELAAYEGAVEQLALAARDATPPPGLKQKVMDGLQTPLARPGRAQRSWRQRLAGPRWRGAPAWAVASLVLAVALVVTNMWWWRQAEGSDATVTPTSLRTIALVGTETAPDAAGTLVLSADGEYGTLVVDGLPVLDARHQYQLWLIRDGQRTSGGVFSVGDEGYGALPVASPAPLLSYPAFGVTIEPAGGSPGPTGDKVLGSSS